MNGLRKKIAFVKYGSFSHINDAVLNILQREFPECAVEVTDVRDLVSVAGLRNAVATLMEYRKDVLLGRKRLKPYLVKSSYAFETISHSLRQALHDDYLFTFQTQALFDASRPGTPHFLYTDHAHLVNPTYPDFEEEQLASERWIALEKKAYRRASMNFTMSTNVARSMVETYGCEPARVACVYAGSNLPGTTGSQDAKRYRSKEILFVGVEWERKGGPVLMAAFEKLLRTHPDAKLTIVGCSPSVSLPNCDVVGRVPLPEVARYFNKAAVFCMPTRREPFGIVFIEAMMHKLPVVATDLGAIPDFVSDGHNGFLVGPDDAEGLALRLGELISNPEKAKRFGHRGFDVARGRYSWEGTGKRIRRHVEDVLQGSLEHVRDYSQA